MRPARRMCYLAVATVVLSAVLVSVCYGAEVHSTVLDNGLAVVTCTHSASDVASVFVGFRVGAGIAQPVGIRALLHEHKRARVEQLLADNSRSAPQRIWRSCLDWSALVCLLQVSSRSCWKKAGNASKRNIRI